MCVRCSRCEQRYAEDMILDSQTLEVIEQICCVCYRQYEKEGTPFLQVYSKFLFDHRSIKFRLESSEDIEEFFSRLPEIQDRIRHARTYWIVMRYITPKGKEFWKFIPYERNLEDEDLLEFKRNLLFRAKQGPLDAYEEQAGLEGFIG